MYLATFHQCVCVYIYVYTDGKQATLAQQIKEQQSKWYGYYCVSVYDVRWGGHKQKHNNEENDADNHTENWDRALLPWRWLTLLSHSIRRQSNWLWNKGGGETAGEREGKWVKPITLQCGSF